MAFRTRSQKIKILEIETASEQSKDALTVVPIGFISTDMVKKFDAPHQPDRESSRCATIELLPYHDFHKALEDLDGFEHIWLIFWFHRNSTWRPKVRLPRGQGKKRGVFATRSPHRPNGIGMTAVPLLEVTGRTIVVGACDLVDGTPIIDIKPYIPTVDSFPNSRIGWLQEIEDSFSEPPAFTVKLSERVEAQSASLAPADIALLQRARELLSRDPSPNRTRRIRKVGANLFRMGCADWRIFFSVSGQEVLLEDMSSRDMR